MRITEPRSSAVAVDGRFIATIKASSPISAPGPAMISAPPSSTRKVPLHDIAGIGGVADLEQHLTCIEITLLGADRQHAQGAVAQQTHRRDLLEQGYVIIDRHSGPVTAVRLDFTNR